MRITETFEDMRFSTKVREILSAEVDGLARHIDREVAAFGLYTDWYCAIQPELWYPSIEYQNDFASLRERYWYTPGSWRSFDMPTEPKLEKPKRFLSDWLQQLYEDHGWVGGLILDEAHFRLAEELGGLRSSIVQRLRTREDVVLAVQDHDEESDKIPRDRMHRIAGERYDADEFKRFLEGLVAQGVGWTLYDPEHRSLALVDAPRKDEKSAALFLEPGRAEDFLARHAETHGDALTPLEVDLATVLELRRRSGRDLQNLKSDWENGFHHVRVDLPGADAKEARAHIVEEVFSLRFKWAWDTLLKEGR